MIVLADEILATRNDFPISGRIHNTPFPSRIECNFPVFWPSLILNM